MKKLRHALALFLALAMLMSMALSEEQLETLVDDAPAAEAVAPETEVTVPEAPPTVEPTEEPTEEPTAEPTEEPSEEPTAEPTEEPTAEPTEESTAEPTEEPAEKPTEGPTEEPTDEPTQGPSPAEQLAAELGLTLEELAEQLGVDVSTLQLQSENALRALYEQTLDVEPKVTGYWVGDPNYTVVSDFVIQHNGTAEGTVVEYIGLGGDVTVPEGWQGGKVTAIADDLIKNQYSTDAINRITRLTIPATVKKIGRSAFFFDSYSDSRDYGARSLTGVKILGSNVTIGANAFRYCDAMTSVVISGDDVIISEEAFYASRGLTSVVLSGDNVSIGDRAFSECYSLAEVTIPENVKRIGDGAFSGCLSLTLPSLKITSDNAYIGSDAFGVVYINTNPFGPSVISVEISGDNASIDGFGYCMTLTSVKITGHDVNIRGGAFTHCEGLTHLEITGNNVTIGEDAFGQCNALTDLEIPGNNITFDERAFDWCYALTSVKITGENPNIGPEAFFQNETLTSVEITGNNANIASGAFENCYLLSSVKILGDNVDIGEYTFPWCKELVELEIPGDNITIGNGAFSTCSVPSLTIPGNGISIGAWAFSSSKIQNVHITGSITSLGAGVFQGCSELKEVELPEGITEFPESIFEECGSLQKLNFPSTVRAIGDRAFASSEITSFRIPGTVERIGEEAFYDCRQLTTLVVEEGVTDIGAGAFKESAIRNMRVPGTVKRIGDEAFDYCKNLVSLVVEEGVTTIGANAFSLSAVHIGFSYYFKLNLPASLTEIDPYAFAAFYGSLILPEGDSYVKRFCDEHKIRYSSEIKFTGVQDGDTVPMNGYKLSWKAIPGAYYFVDIFSPNDGMRKNGNIYVKKNNYTISFSKYSWIKPGSEIYIEVDAYTDGRVATGLIMLRPGGNATVIKPSKVTVTPSKLTLGVGSSQQLSCVVTPEGADQSVSYKSSNNKVATVSEEGLVIALKKGSATITVKTSNGKTATCKVTVVDVPKSVKLDMTTLTLAAGQTGKLKATVKPSGAATTLSWESSDANVATVADDGTVTAVGVGETTISVKTHNYTSSKPKLMATCKVTVKTAPKTLTIPEALTLGKGETYTLEPEIDEGSYGTFTFESSKPTIVKVSKKGKLTALKTGTATITVTVNGTLSKECTVPVVKAPSKVTLGPKKATLSVGETFEFTATLPSGTASKLTTSTTKASVATITQTEPGKFTITALKKGKATITVKTFNGKSAKFNLTVK